MNAVREFPPNPHALLIHVDELLTEQIVETYLEARPEQPAWIREVLSLPGVRVLSINAYKIGLQKQKHACWHDVQGPFEAILGTGLGVRQITDLVSNESRRRRFAWHGPPLTRAVYEGRLQASVNALAAELFRVHGVAEVILDGHEVEIRRCPMCDWGQMSAAIEERLEQRA